MALSKARADLSRIWIDCNEPCARRLEACHPVISFVLRREPSYHAVIFEVYEVLCTSMVPASQVVAADRVTSQIWAALEKVPRPVRSGDSTRHVVPAVVMKTRRGVVYAWVSPIGTRVAPCVVAGAQLSVP